MVLSPNWKRLLSTKARYIRHKLKFRLRNSLQITSRLRSLKESNDHKLSTTFMSTTSTRLSPCRLKDQTSQLVLIWRKQFIRPSSTRKKITDTTKTSLKYESQFNPTNSFNRSSSSQQCTPTKAWKTHWWTLWMIGKHGHLNSRFSLYQLSKVSSVHTFKDKTSALSNDQSTYRLRGHSLTKR